MYITNILLKAVTALNNLQNFYGSCIICEIQIFSLLKSFFPSKWLNKKIIILSNFHGIHECKGWTLDNKKRENTRVEKRLNVYYNRQVIIFIGTVWNCHFSSLKSRQKLSGRAFVASPGCARALASQQQAFLALLWLGFRAQHGSYGLVEDRLEPLLSESWAF